MQMHWDGTLIRETRIALGLTQVELATQAGVSLPSVQNIESGRATNPSVETLSALFSVLGLELAVKPKEPDWDTLIACGAPLTPHHSKRLKQIRPTADVLLRSLRQACSYLSRGKKGSTQEPRESREELGVQALLLALKYHYPTFFRNNCSRASLLVQFCPENPNGPQIKLKRQATAVLATYL
jgi:transcriptional regulator with XRE-family HTH domain